MPTFIDYPTVGYVVDPQKPEYPAVGHDSWTTPAGFRAWIRKHQAVCEPIPDAAAHPG